MLEETSQNTIQQLAIKAYIETLSLKNYSQCTIKNYKNHFIPFLNFFHDKKPSKISKEEIISYLLYVRNKELECFRTKSVS